MRTYKKLIFILLLLLPLVSATNKTFEFDKIGEKVYPSYPEWGWVIFYVFMFFIIMFAVNFFDNLIMRIKGW